MNENQFKVLLTVALILIAVLHFSSVNNEINGLGGDNAYYILLAKSLASFDGYRGFTPGNPPHTKYPPVFPLMLTPVIWLFGINFMAFHVVVVLAELSALVFLYLFFRRMAGQHIAFFCCVVFALNYFVNLSLVRILTEFPYLMITAAALLLTEKAEEENKTSIQYIWLPMLVSLTYLTRTAGLSFFVAFLFYRLYRQHFKILLWNTPILFLPYLAWKFRARIYGASGGYFSELWLKSYNDPGLGNVSILEFIERIQLNIQKIAYGISDFVFPGMQYHSMALVILVCALVLTGFIWRSIKRQCSLMEFYIAVYLCMLAAWPIYEPRKLMPIVPFIYFYLLLGINYLFQIIRTRKNRYVSWVKDIQWSLRVNMVTGIVGIFLIAIQILPTLELIKIRSLQLLIPQPKNQEYHGFTVDWSHYRVTYYWIKMGNFAHYAHLWSNYLYLSYLAGKVSSLNDVIMARKNSLTALYSDRPTICYPWYRDLEKQHQNIVNNGVAYIILDGIFRDTFTYLFPYIKANPENFKVVAKKGNAYLLEVLKNR